MNTGQEYTRIATDETLRETIHHGSEEYPFCYYLEDIWSFDFHCIDWHWHPEVEFVFMQKGRADILIGSERFLLEEGCGLFVNSQVIHRYESAGSAICPNIVFSPILLAAEDSLIYQKYIQPVLASSISCQLYSPSVPWQRRILDTLRQIFALQEEKEPSEILTLRLLLKMWDLLYDNTRLTDRPPLSHTPARTQAQLQIMLQYIHKNFPRHISLEELAETVMLSKSSVLHLFNKYLHTSPISYLVDHRLKQAAKLLVRTENNISFVAQETGFENIGYFCRKFKELFGATPTEYRRRALEEKHSSEL